MNAIYENRTCDFSYHTQNNISTFAHLHKEFELIYVIDGKGVAYTDSNSYTLSRGDLFFTFPNQVHYYSAIESGTFVVLIFSPNLIYNMGYQITQSVPDTNYIPCGSCEFSNIFKKLTELDGEYKNMAMVGYTNVIISMLMSRIQMKSITEETNSAFSVIVDFCSKNFCENLTLDYLSENLHFSKYYISRIINQHLHQSFSQYINSLRVSEACILLKDPKMKISDISEEVGFGSIRSFNRAFKQFFGVTPEVYKKALNNPEKKK